MFPITVASSVNCELKPSLCLGFVFLGGYAFLTLLCFVFSALPLEVVVVIQVLLINECRQKHMFFYQQTGTFSFQANGRIYWQENQYFFTSLCFFSTPLIILKIHGEDGHRYLFLCKDMCDTNAFRHLSRVTLLAAKKASD